MGKVQKRKERWRLGSLRSHQAQRPRSLLQSIVRYVAAGLGFFVSLVAALEFYYAMTPKVSTTFTDHQDVFAAPFEITNNGNWFNVYKLTPVCGISDIEGPDIKLKGFAVAAAGETLTLEPGQSAQYKCDITARYRHVKKSRIIIWGTYDLIIIPHVWRFRRGFESQPFQWWFDTSGNPHWLEGEILK